MQQTTLARVPAGGKFFGASGSLYVVVNRTSNPWTGAMRIREVLACCFRSGDLFWFSEYMLLQRDDPGKPWRAAS